MPTPFHPAHKGVYVLATDWWTPCGTTFLRPAYNRGQPGGTMGFLHPAALWPFPSHDAAIRHMLDPFKHPMPDLNAHIPLTAADVLDLRVSARTRVADIGAPASVPCVHYNVSIDGYELRQGTAVLCWSRSLAVVAALLRAERFEPGFIRRALDPSFTPEEIGLDIDAREAARRARADQEARSRAQREAEADDDRRRRLYAGGPSTAPPDLSLDDLLDPFSPKLR